MRSTLILIVFVLLSCWLSVCVYGDEPYPNGDVNLDNAINAADSLDILEHVARIESMGTYKIVTGDVNRDYKCDAKDALCILKYSAGIIKSFDEVIETSIAKTEVADYENVRVIRTGSNYRNGNQLRERVIYTYDEYKEYINEVRRCVRRYSEQNEIDLFAEKFFENNVLYVADFWIGSGSIKHEFLGVTESEGLTSINIERFSPSGQSCDMAHWDIIVPLEGKDYTVGNVEVNFEKVYVEPVYYYDCGKSVPVYENSSYLKKLTTYEEYLEYITLFKEKNPDYVLEREYTEEEFEYLDVVVGGFWTFSGQLELDYNMTISKDGKMTIYFDGMCPSPYSDDSDSFHYIISYPKLSFDEDDFSYEIKTEFYELSTN